MIRRLRVPTLGNDMNRLLTLAPSLALALIALPKSFGLFWAVLMIAGLIFLHELGHFLAAKWMGMPVETFSLGFGSRLVGFKWRETDVRLSVLPLGGYVKLAGYNPEEPDAEDPHGFLLQPFRKRMLFYSGGVLANVATAFVIFYGLSVNQCRYPLPPVILQVMPGSAAEAGGLKTGDELKRVGTLSLPEADWNDEIVPFIQKNPGTPIPFQIQRDGQLMQLTLSPRFDGKVGRLGIQNLPGEPKGTPRAFRISDLAKAGPMAFRATYNITLNVLQGYGRLVVGRVSVKEIGGPIAIAKAGSDAAKAGISAFLLTCAFISLNLAVLNALPIPFLDGGHMAILVFEKLRRKDLSIRLKEKILTAGFFFLASLMVFVIALDFWKMKH
jgi:regulator of sigma E protease